MAGRWRDPSAFRADPAAAPSSRPSRRQTVSLLAVLLMVAGAVVVASYVVRPDRARAFQLFKGSLFLANQQSPVAVDLPSGRATLRLSGAEKQVGVKGTDPLDVVPLDGGTLLLNGRSGEFNMVDNSGFVVKHDGGGVPLGRAAGQTSAIGVADGALAYVIRKSPARTDVFLVSQATVTAALSATGAVAPRASTALTNGSIEPQAGGTVAAGGALWALVDTGGDTKSVREFTYPADSNAGARLTSHGHGTLSGVAALGTAATGNGTAVGVAAPDRIRILSPARHTVEFLAPAGVDRILPATEADGRLAYLMQGAAGWSLVSVNADGSGLRPPRLVDGLPAGDALAQPAYSRGALYTLDRASGAVYRIDLDGTVEKVAVYPVVRGVESPDLGDGLVVARGSRVIVNSGNHSNALVLFTDGSHPPRVVEKRTAVTVNAAGGAEALTGSTANPTPGPERKPAPGAPKPPPAPVQVVNPRLNCADVTQTPHVPSIDTVQPGSRSVTLTWTYPIIDKTQDCVPTTYLVEVQLLSTDAPQPPGSVRVQSQQGATITGLFPQSRYKVQVTAFIHDRGTASGWIPVTTGPEGPAAPTGLTVAPDANGNWILNWNSCGSVQQGCVPAQSWTVTPSFCDSRGLSAPPAAATAPADPTTRQQPTFKYSGGDALLGRGLQFVVTGSGTTQVAGTPSAKSACVYSWTNPDAAAMTLTASKPANSTLGGTTSTTVRLDLAGNPTHDVGGIGAKIQFQLTGPDGNHSQSVTFDGGSSVTATFTGLRAGADYQATAVVSPPGHADASVQIGPQTVTPAADWPDVGLTAHCPTDAPLNLTCSFTADISGISSAAVNGETFDIVDANGQTSQIVCGDSSKSLDDTGIDPANPIQLTLSTVAFHGSCTATIVLKENGPVFGGVLKTISDSFSVGTPTTYNPSSDWTAAWESGVSVAKLSYSGSLAIGDLGRITKQWQATLLGPQGQTCSDTSTSDNPPDGAELRATTDCVHKYGDQSGWSVHLTYYNVLDDPSTTSPHPASVNGPSGPPPGYQPCNPGTFKAAWGATQADGITVTYGGSVAQLAGCGSLTYTVLQGQTTCATATSPDPSNPYTFQPSDYATCTLDNTWVVRVTWHNTNTGQDESAPDIPLGSPPTQ